MATRDAIATRADTYTYTSVAMPDEDHYIHRFEPRASAKVVHHMLLFGCSGAASPTLRTREGGMFSAGGGGQPRGAVCAGEDPEPFIFGWGKDAPDLYLPDGTGSTSAATPGSGRSCWRCTTWRSSPAPPTPTRRAA